MVFLKFIVKFALHFVKIIRSLDKFKPAKNKKNEAIPHLFNSNKNKINFKLMGAGEPHPLIRRNSPRTSA